MLITNIKFLVNVREQSDKLRGTELADLPILKNAFLKISNNRIADYGLMSALAKNNNESVFDAAGKIILPAWCDSHTHLVFAETREEEFIDKIKGLSYAAIAAKGGGILNSAEKLATISEDELFQQSLNRLKQVVHMGTGAIEIKSGYGLSIEGELKMLRVIKRLKAENIIPIKATFLGAHAVPKTYKDNKAAYMKLIVEEMLPVIKEQGLADYIDVFCEDGFFTQDETELICKAGITYGLKPKIHANQLNISGGVQAGYNSNALSVDHLETISDEEIEILSRPEAPIATLLPTVAFFLGMNYPPVRKLIESNAAIALASDYNPGSSPSGNMNLVIAMSCIQMKMLPQEAINAATTNGAYAMELENEVGSITKGKLANLIITKNVPSVDYLPYSFGENHIYKMIINGEVFD